MNLNNLLEVYEWTLDLKTLDANSVSAATTPSLQSEVEGVAV